MFWKLALNHLQINDIDCLQRAQEQLNVEYEERELNDVQASIGDIQDLDRRSKYYPKQVDYIDKISKTF